MLTLRCQSCKSSNLEIRQGTPPHYASLCCCDCDRFVRWLSQYQAKTFQRHLPTAQEPGALEQLNLLEGGEL
uniref:Uncharacterized protein n=1 Tax=Oscillatoriales cyanobacterium SpSt-402 TaxID=2282168 RepID=A0A832H5B6_9CYAN